MRLKELADKVYDFEMRLTERYLSNGNAGFVNEDERLNLAHEYSRITYGQNHLEWISDGGATEKYFPSLYVREPAARSPLSAAMVLTGAPHMAFRLGENTLISELFYGKYQACQKTSNGKALMLSLRGLDCKTYITLDAAVAAFKNNGGTHHLITNAEYAYRILKCRAQSFQPQGNCLYGHDEQGNYGDPCMTYDSGSTKYIGRVLQGSGPLTWFDDGSPLGIWGLNGNVWEWCSGFRLNGGEINILPLNTAALATADLSAASAEWKSILTDGTLAAPGATGALKFGPATADNTITLSSQTVSSVNAYYGLFKNLDYATQPTLLKELSILPCDTGDYGGDYIYISTDGERAAFRGGYWYGGSYYGLSALGLDNPRSSSNGCIGARGSFYRTAA